MIKYYFTPEILDALPEKLAELYRELEDTLLYEICSRLNISGELNEVTVQSIRTLRSHGIDIKDIKKAIIKTTNISKKELDKLFDDVVKRNENYFDEVITLSDITEPFAYVDKSDIDAIRKQTHDEISNITRSMGFYVRQGGQKVLLDGGEAYQWALDNAVIQIQSGAISYNQAISSAIKQLADSGLKTVNYESGHVDSVDVAVRRAVLTGIVQINSKYNSQAMDRFETDLVEVDAHMGARNIGVGAANHEGWQGKVYRWTEYTDKYPNSSTGEYPDFIETTGYGTGEGLCGWNCRHGFVAFVEGVMKPTYTDDELEKLKAKPFEFEGKQYDTYTATQKQRQIERTIRKLKRRKLSYEAAGDKENATTTNIRIRRLKSEYKSFSKAAGLPEQPERMKVYFAGGENIWQGVGDDVTAPENNVTLLGNIDYTDEKAILKTLKQYQTELDAADHEVSINVTKSGNIWRVDGDEVTVDTARIPEDLSGSYSYHNHLPSKTNYSFGASDVSFFIETKEKIAIASDDIYEYIMKREADTVDIPYQEAHNRFKEVYNKEILKRAYNEELDIDNDGYHEVLKILSEEMRFDYVRKRKNQ